MFGQEQELIYEEEKIRRQARIFADEMDKIAEEKRQKEQIERQKAKELEEKALKKAKEIIRLMNLCRQPIKCKSNVDRDIEELCFQDRIENAKCEIM